MNNIMSDVLEYLATAKHRGRKVHELDDNQLAEALWDALFLMFGSIKMKVAIRAVLVGDERDSRGCYPAVLVEEIGCQNIALIAGEELLGIAGIHAS